MARDGDTKTELLSPPERAALGDTGAVPLILGGQGRSSISIRESACVVGIVLAVAAVMAAWAVAIKTYGLWPVAAWIGMVGLILVSWPKR